MTQNTIRNPVPENDPAQHGDADKGIQPAAAPMATDEEAGRQGARRPAEDAYVTRSKGEVRAGPGDAGMQSAPRVLDNPKDKPKRGRGPLVMLLLAGPVLLIVVWLLTV